MRLKTLARFDLGIVDEWENVRMQKRKKDLEVAGTEAQLGMSEVKKVDVQGMQRFFGIHRR